MGLWWTRSLTNKEFSRGTDYCLPQLLHCLLAPGDKLTLQICCKNLSHHTNIILSAAEVRISRCLWQLTGWDIKVLADCVKYKRYILVDGDCISFRIWADDRRQWDFNSQTIFTKNNLLFQFQIAATWPMQVWSSRFKILSIVVLDYHQ